MVNCMVKSCRSRGKIKGITYHQIPKKNPKPWFDALKRSPSKYVTHRNVVCSRHFRPENFKGGKHVYLKPGVVPSLHLDNDCKKKLHFIEPNEETETAIDNDTPGTSTDQEALITITENLSTASDSDSSENTDSSKETDASVGETVVAREDHQYCKLLPEDKCFKTPNISRKRKRSTFNSDVVVSLKNDEKSASSSDSIGLRGSPKKRRKLVRSLHTYGKSPRKLEKYVNLEKQRTAVFKKKLKNLREKNKRLKRRVSNLQDIVKDLRKQNLLSADALSHLEQSFSGVPLAVMRRMFIANRSKKKITAKYPNELRTFALTLQCYSPKAYEYVRSTFNLCLPAQSVIRSWISNVDCKPGFTAESFAALEEKVKQSKYEVFCSLVLDEMHIKKQIEIANKETWGYIDLGTGVSSDELVCATQVLVLMVVAMNSNWKMPIAYFLINNLTAEERANIVRESLHRLHSIGVKVISMTCDGPSVNFSLLSALGCNLKDVNNQKTYFKHPNSDHNIYVQIDTCHLLKLIRNNWATLEKFKDPDGNLVDFSYIKELYKLQEDEGLRAATKLRKKHMEWYRQKMKVNLAAQTLSSSVAVALEFLSKDLNLPAFRDVQPTIKFLKLVDQVFDLLNSRNPFAPGFKGPLRLKNEHIWKPKFEEAIHYFSNCKDIKGTYLYKTPKKTPFIGMLVTINSTIGIFNEYVKQENSDLKYLLTYKCSQDHLELFFCSVRARNGWNNNPTAYQFSNTYRRLLLHHEIKALNGNITAQDSTNALYIIKSKKEKNPAHINSTLSLTDINTMRKYNLDVTNNSDLDHTYCLPNTVSLSQYTENVVAYIAGYVIKMIEKKIKCNKCVYALNEYDLETRDDMNLKLIKRKKYGNLKVPSRDLINICCETEKKIKQMLQITEGKVPPENTYQDLLIHSITTKFINDKNTFSDLYYHLDNICIEEEHHVKRLINLIVLSYCKIRINSIAKKQSENMHTALIRKKLSKLILFNNQ